MHLVLAAGTPADLEALFDWLDGDADISVRRHLTPPKPGELGPLADALIVSVGAGGALTVLAASLRGFFQQPRRSKVKVSVRREADGAVTAEIDADRVRGADVEAMLARILDES